MSIEIDKDFYCEPNKLNSSLFPVGSAKLLDRNFNILPFLCDLLQNASMDDSVSPVLVPPEEFDITPFTNYAGLTSVGDPRVSLGETISATFVNFLPRMITQTEVMQSGGTQIIDNYICDADGITIKESETVPILLSLDLTGQKPYQYGAIYVPPVSAVLEDLMKPIHPTEIITYVKSYVNDSKIQHIGYFVDFCYTYFLNKPNWSVNVSEYQVPKNCMVTLSHKDDTGKIDKKVYLKYYSDVSKELACKLGTNQVTYYAGATPISNNAELRAETTPVPNYKELYFNKYSQEDFYNKVLSDFKSTPADDYTTIFSTSATSAPFLSALKDASITSNMPVVSTFNIIC
jgi:hypothetical protein